MLKPMLALDDNKVDLSSFFEKGGYLIASPKLDGIRGSVQGEIVLSRSLKPIRSSLVQETFGSPLLEGFDGEFICGSATAESVYRDTVSACMSETTPPESEVIKFYVWDLINEPSLTYEERLDKLSSMPRPAQVVFLGYRVVRNMAEVRGYEEECLTAGYEGIILKNPKAKYKHGRASKTKLECIKVKRFVDAEAEVLEVLPKLHNGNEAKINELGLTQRSSAKEGLTPTEEVGKLRVKDLSTGNVFYIGVFRNLSKKEKESLWLTRDQLIGKIVKYKYFPIGLKELPRHPIYLGLRDEDDME